MLAPYKQTLKFSLSFLAKLAAIVAAAPGPSPKKSIPARLTRDELEGEENSQFGCHRFGLTGLTQDFLLSVHLKMCCEDNSKSAEQSSCPQYEDIATFDNFIDCQGHKYASDNYGIYTQCCLVLHFRPQFSRTRS